MTLKPFRGDLFSFLVLLSLCVLHGPSSSHGQWGTDAYVPPSLYSSRTGRTTGTPTAAVWENHSPLVVPHGGSVLSLSLSLSSNNNHDNKDNDDNNDDKPLRLLHWRRWGECGVDLWVL